MAATTALAMVRARFSQARCRRGGATQDETRSGGGILRARETIPGAGIPSSAGGEMTAGEILRYLAEAEPERVWLQLSLEQVPIKGTP